MNASNITCDGLSAPKRTRLWRAAVFAALSLTGFVFYLPWTPLMPANSVDVSWGMVLNHAFSSEMAFGSNIVFIYGPYGFLCANVYDPKTFGLIFWGTAFIMLAAAACLERVLWEKAPRKWWPPLLLAAALAFGNLFDITAIIAFLLYWRVVREKQIAPVDLLIIPAVALVSLTKFTDFIIVCGFIAAMAVDDLSRKAAPWRSISLAGCIALLWCAAGQRLFGLFDFVLSSINVVQGYTPAMALWDKPEWHALVGAAAIICMLCAIAMVSWRSAKSPALAHFFIAALILFGLFKSAFVRHDEHELALILQLPLAAIGYLLVFGVPRSVPQKIASALLIAPLCYPFIVTIGAGPIYYGKNFVLYKFVDSLERQHAIRHAMRGTWLPELRDSYDQAVADARASTPIHASTGSTDIYSFRQYLIFVNDLKYFPRPMFQSLTAYTAYLARLNGDNVRDWYTAPDTLLFAVEPIDGRLAAMEDGLSWPLILSLYDLTGVDGKLLRFEKSATPRKFRLDPLKARSVELGKDFELPATDDGFVWAEAETHLSLAGYLLAFLYKVQPPFLLVNREPTEKRLIPEVMKAGFLVSPLINGTDDFAALARGEMYKLLKVGRMRIDCPPKWRFCYNPYINIRFYHLNMRPNQR